MMPNERADYGITVSIRVDPGFRSKLDMAIEKDGVFKSLYLMGDLFCERFDDETTSDEVLLATIAALQYFAFRVAVLRLKQAGANLDDTESIRIPDYEKMFVEAAIQSDVMTVADICRGSIADWMKGYETRTESQAELQLLMCLIYSAHLILDAGNW